VEVVLLSALGSGATPSVEGATLVPAKAAGVAEGTTGAAVVLAVEGAGGVAPVVSSVPPVLGGSVVLGAGAAPTAVGASLDARFSSPPATHGSVAGLAVNAGSRPGVVWLVFLFFFFFFFFFFSSFFSSASLGGGGEKKLGER
jgi:hypothetical protein